MAYVKIFPIKANTHLGNSVEYVLDDLKTNNCLYVDSFKCTPRHIDDDFAYTRSKAPLSKGNNLAWHIVQSFSPDDNVTPEQALDIGKELMRRMYPDYQYVISTHTDKEHIHNHIIMCSVNLKDFHKLNSNKKSLLQMQKISDDICKENSLSVIVPTKITARLGLKNDMDNAIMQASSMYDFISIMQAKGYSVKKGKYLSFKSPDMQKYIRSSSISIDYTEAMIKSRIESKAESKRLGRERYDDKVVFSSKRKRLQTEIDASLRKVKTYEEFIADMKRKNFEVKEGKHLAFKGEEQQRFIRSESISEHYSEEVIRFRLDCREEWEDMQRNKISRVIDRTDLYDGLNEWAAGENSNAQNLSTAWIRDNITNGENYGLEINLGMFLIEGYDKELAKINQQQIKIEELNSQMRELVKVKQAIQHYWSLKPVMETAGNLDIEHLSERDLINFKDVVQSNNKKFQYSISVMNEAIKKYGSVSIKDINERMNVLLNEKKKEQLELTRLKLNFDVYETIKYNYTKEKDGYGIDEKQARAKYLEYKDGIKYLQEEKQEKAAKKQERKDKIKNFFHID
jgi:hypothetical protein